MSDLVDFLRARLAEDEQLARAATAGPWRHSPDKHWRKPDAAWFEEAVFAGPPGKAATCVAGTGETDDPQSMADADHIARHDPERVLRGVAAKRKLIAEFERCGPQTVGYSGLLGAVRIAAEEYDYHPDHREEWRP